MSSHVSESLRSELAARADYLCEYCLIHETDTFFGCEVDHVISVKHGGTSEANNLAYACMFCNRRKGSDTGSIDWETGEFVRFFNPRSDRWADHFGLNGASIESQTAIGAVTARILGFNDADRALEQEILIAVNRYPSPAALIRMEARYGSF